MEASEPQQVLLEAARRTAGLVGDGAVVLTSNDAGGFDAVAVEHHRREGEERLERLLHLMPERPARTWLEQALDRRQTLRLPASDAERRSLPIPEEVRLGDVMFVPLPDTDAVIVATRDRWSEPYSGAQRQVVERIARETEAAIGGAELPIAGADLGTDFDPIAHRVLDATAAGVWVVDERNRTVYVNDATCQIVGAPANEIKGMPIGDYLGRVSQNRPGGFYGGETLQRPLVRADGAVAWVQTTSAPLPSAREGLVLHTLLRVDAQHEREVATRMRLSRTEALLELAESAAAGMPMKELLAAAVELIAEQLDVEFAGIGRFDLESLQGKALAFVGWPDPTGNGREVMPTSILEDSAAAIALRSGEPVMVWDYESPDNHPRDPLLERLGIRTAAIVPFAGGEAAVAAHSARPSAVDGQGIELLESVARLIGPRWQTALETTDGGEEPVSPE